MLNNKYRTIALAACLSLALVNCEGCDKEKLELLKHLDNMQSCQLAYQEQTAHTYDRIDKVRDELSCFQANQLEDIELLKQDLSARLKAFEAEFSQSMQDNRVEALKAKIIVAERDLAEIGKDYQRLQEYQGYCRTQQILAGKDKGPALGDGVKLEDQNRLFLHALGDVFGKNSGYEGSSPLVNLEHRHNILKTIKNQLEGHIFIADAAQAKPCATRKLGMLPQTPAPYPDISQSLLSQLIEQSDFAITLTKDFEAGSLGKFRRSLASKLQALKEGQSVFFAAGWTMHAVLYQIKKEKSDGQSSQASFSFRIYNGGDGAQYHVDAVVAYKSQIFPFVEVGNLSLERITSFAFINSLKKIATPGGDDGKSNAKELYQRLLVGIGGKSVEAKYDAGLLTDPQNAGTCSYYAMPWVLNSSVAQFLDGDRAQKDRVAEQLEFLIGLKTLDDYRKNRESNAGELSEDTLNLLAKGNTFYAASTAIASNNGVIDAGTMTAAVNNVEAQTANWVAKKRLEMQESAAKNAPQYGAPDGKTDSFYRLAKSISGKAEIEARAGISGEKNEFIEVDEWMPPPSAKLAEDLDGLYKVLLDSSQAVAVSRAIQMIAMRLPLQDDAYWQALEGDQAKQIISSLSKLDTLYVFTLLKLIKLKQQLEKSVFYVDYLVTVKLLTVADLLNQNTIKDINPPIPSMATNSIHQFLNGDLSVVETADPRWHDQINQLRDYYKHTGTSSFFSLDFYPVGAYEDGKAANRKLHYETDPSVVQVIAAPGSHWSFRPQWPDLDWAMQWIRQQANFATVLMGGREKFQPWSRSCKDETGKGATCGPSRTPASVERTNVDNLVRLHAVNLLLKGKSSNQHFPDVLPGPFYDLRTLSLLSDFVLTSGLSFTSVANNLWGMSIASGIGPHLDNYENKSVSFYDSSIYPNEQQCFCKYNDQQCSWQTKTVPTGNRDYDGRPTYRDEGKWECKDNWQTVAGKTQKSTSTSLLNTSYWLFGKPVADLIAYEDMDKLKVGSLSWVHPLIHVRNAQKALKSKDSKEDLSKLYGTQAYVRRRVPPNALILIDPKREALSAQINLERMRDIMGISAFKGQQIIQVLAYFSKHPHLLTQEDYQTLFTRLAVEPALILDQLKISDEDSRLIASQLAAFCKERIAYPKTAGDFRTLAFLLLSNQLFIDQINYARSKLDDYKVGSMDKVVFVNSREELAAAAQHSQGNERAFLYRSLAQTFLNESVLSDQDMTWLLTGVVAYHTYAQKDPSLSDAFVERALENLLTMYAQQLNARLAVESTRDKILNAVAKSIRSQLMGEPKWHTVGKSSPYAVYEAQFADSKAVSINVKSGTLFIGGAAAVEFPMMPSAYHSIFGNVKAPDNVAFFSPSTYQWQDTKGLIVRIKRDAANQWIVQKQMKKNGIFYEYVTAQEALEALKGVTVQLVGDFDYWQSVGSSSAVELSVLDAATKLPQYTVAISGSQVTSIKRLSDGAVLNTAEQASSYAVFNQIEDSKFIYIWLQPKADNALVEVELPRLGLHFKPHVAGDGTVKLGCASQTGCVIAENQYNFAFGQPINYLVCKNAAMSDKRQSFVLTPVERFIPRKNMTSLETNFLVDRQEDKQNANSIPVFYYNVVLDDSANPLKYTHDEQRYYMALRYLWQHQYTNAAETIRGAGSELKEFSEDDIKVLKWITEGNPIDHDPRSLGVRLLALYWLYKDSMYYHGRFDLETNFATSILAVYGEYLNKVGSLNGQLFLSNDEERRLVEALLKLFVQARLKLQESYQQQIEKSNDELILENRIEALKREKTGSVYFAVPGNMRAVHEASPEQTPADFFRVENGFRAKLYERSVAQGVSALDMSPLISNENWALLYDIAAGKGFNRQQALEILKKIYMDSVNDVDGLSDAEIREEFETLMRLASRVPLSSDANAERRSLASYLVAVSDARQDGRALYSAQEIQAKYHTIDNMNEQIRQLESQINSLYYNRYYNDHQEELWRAVSNLRDKIDQLRKEQSKIESGLRTEHYELVRSKKYHELKPAQIKKSLIEQRGTMKARLPASREEIKQAQVPIAEVSGMDPLTQAVIPQALLDQMIDQNSLNAEQKTKLLNEADSLNNVLSRAKPMPKDVWGAVEGLQDKITREAKAQADTQKFYAVKAVGGKEALERQQQELTEKLSRIEAELKDRKKQILAGGRQYAKDMHVGSYNQALHLGDIGKPAELNDMIYLLLKKNLVVVQQRSGVDDVDQLNGLYKDIVLYLMYSTYADQLRRVRDAIGGVLANPDSQQLLGKLVDTALSQRNYAIADHVEYLIFEYYMQILIRIEQIKSLELLSIRDGKIHDGKSLGALLEMIMGAGKTSVLLPLLSMLDNDGQYINVIMLPEALIASMSVQLSDQLSSAFGNAVDVFHFSRQRYLTENDLKLLYDRLVRARVENRTIITTNSSIQSLFLSFADKLYRYPKDKNQVSGEIAEFIKIFRYLRSYARLTIDEADLALDILQSHQFSVGTPVPLMYSPVLRILPHTALALYYFLESTPAICSELNLPFLGCASGGKALTEESYKALKPHLLEAILKAPNFYLGDRHLNDLFVRFLLEPSSRELAKNYLLNQTRAARDQLFSQIDRQVEGIDRTTVKDMFAALYEEINHVFFLTASKKLNVHYGPLPKPIQKSAESKADFAVRDHSYMLSRYLAIPYHGGEPMPNSRFGTPLESLNYTLQMSLQLKNYTPLVEDEIAALVNMSKSQKGATQTARFLERLTKLIGEGKHLVVTYVSKEQIEEIVARVSEPAQKKLQFELLARFVLPEVTAYPAQLRTNAQIYESIFARVQGFSGTLWSADTFPLIFNAPVFSNTAEKTFLILWRDYLAQKNREHAVRALSKKPYADLIDDIDSTGGVSGSLMDEAGIFRMQSNHAVAQAMAKHGNRVIYYDAKNEIMQTDEKGKVASWQPNWLITNGRAYWDKMHTTGSDLKLPPQMTSTITVDHHLMSRGLQQTAWRLRGLGQGQQISQYVGLEPDFELIKKRMSKDWGIALGNTELDLGDLILYAVVNQEVRLGELRFRALKQKLTNVLVRHVMNGMTGPFSLIDTTGQIYELSKGLFETRLNEDGLYLNLGIPKAAVEKHHAVEEQKTSILGWAVSKAINGVHWIEQKFESLTNREIGKLPDMISANNEEGLEVEVESEQEQEQEQEQEEEVENVQFDPNYTPHPVLSWPTDSLKPIPIELLEKAHDNYNPLVSLPDALRYKGQYFLANAFDDHILMSLNFAPLHHRNINTASSHYEYGFFDRYHKPLTDLLVRVGDADQDIEVVILDGNDVAHWDALLRSGATISSQVALYSLERGVFRHNADQSDVEGLLAKSPRFNALIAQVKFFAGAISYSEDQLQFLQNKFLVGGSQSDADRRAYARQMKNIFRGVILQFKRDTKGQYEGSDINNAFYEILGEEAAIH